MEKEQILSELTTRLGQTSLSSQTLMKYIDLNPLEEGSEPDDTYFNKATGFLQGLQGQYNHDVATQVEDFKKNYKPQPIPDDAKDEPNEGTLAAKLKKNGRRAFAAKGGKRSGEKSRVNQRVKGRIQKPVEISNREWW